MSTLRELRNQRGLTQAQVAEKVGVSNVTLGKWENGKSRPTDDTIARLAEILEVTSDAIELQPYRHYEDAVPQLATLPEANDTSYTIQLGTGTLTLTSTVNFFILSSDERRLVISWLDTLDELKKVATQA